MGKLKKFIMNKIEKVNVQVSMLTCGLIIFSCLVIYLVTSGVMISMLADAYNERANLTFKTIESHFDSRLFIEDVPDGVYGAALSYLSAVKDNMAISEIFVVRKDKNGDFQYILDTKNDKINTVINDEKITGKIEKEINDYELQKELILIGRNSNPYPYIAEADLMIHPSLVESQGITIIESMALGTPVVAVRSKGPEEFIESGKNGYLVDNNEVDITNLIKILYKEPKKRELCAYNATNIIKQFEPDCIIKKIEELLDEKL